MKIHVSVITFPGHVLHMTNLSFYNNFESKYVIVNIRKFKLPSASFLDNVNISSWDVKEHRNLTNYS